MSLYDGINVETAPVPEMSPTVIDKPVESKSMSKHMASMYIPNNAHHTPYTRLLCITSSCTCRWLVLWSQTNGVANKAKQESSQSKHIVGTHN